MSKAMHYCPDSELYVACGVYWSGMPTTSNWNKVTCVKCRKSRKFSVREHCARFLDKMTGAWWHE